MGENFIYTGIVVKGRQLGSRIGFPTANLVPGKENLLPISHGVYAVRVKAIGKMYDGMANIGIRPTFEQNTLTIEAHLFNFSGDLYDQTITIFFYDFIREEKKFPGVDELIIQLKKDRTIISNILSERIQPHTDTY